MSSPEHKEQIWNLIKDVKVGMLATEDQGDMHARPMHLVQKDYDGTIWFFTRRDAEKVDELKSGRNVCLTFSSTFARLPWSKMRKSRPLPKYWRFLLKNPSL